MSKTDVQQEKNMERAVGRRKTSSARVRITPGTGVIVINGRPADEFFPVLMWRQKISAPLEAAGRAQTLDVSVKVVGGGVHSQAEAVRHGIARALVKWDETLKAVLKAEGFLTRDPRAKERKKFGKRRARRGHQWKKR